MTDKMEVEKEVPKKVDKKNKNKKNQDILVEEDLSEADKELKANIELCVTRIQDQDKTIQGQAIDQLTDIVKTSTSSMTSVPKPFKFLKNHYSKIMEYFEKLQASDLKKKLADFLSVLSMTFSEQDSRISLKLLQQGNYKQIVEWGHEYLHHLAGDIGKEYLAILENQEENMENQGQFEDLFILVQIIGTYFMDHNAECDAIDLLMEVDRIDQLGQYVNAGNLDRCVNYLSQCALFCVDHDEMEKTLKTAYDIALQLDFFTGAMRLAIKLDKFEYIKETFDKCEDLTIKKQLCFQIARQRIVIEDMDEELNNIASNSLLAKYFWQLGKDLDVLEPKHPDVVCKTHLDDKGRMAANIDNAKQNLAFTYVNAFVNCGLQKDTLMIKENNQDPWTDKVRRDGLIAAVASIGLVDLWDHDQGCNDVAPFLSLSDGFAKQGACIGIGLFCSGVTSEVDPAKGLLMEHINGNENDSKLGSVIGLGIAYAGSARDDITEELIPLIIDTSLPQDVSAQAALACGLIFVGKCNDDIGNAIIQTLDDRTEQQLDQTNSRYFAVALGLLFLGQQEKSEAIIEALNIISHPIAKYAEICIEGCSYVGSGNVLKVQQMLHLCAEKLDEKKSAFQQVAVIAIALIASSEDIGNEMVLRTLNHILQYCEIQVKRAIPLALALLNISSPKIAIMDLLLKLSHDEDQEMSHRAMFGLGLIGAGTNNSRLADILRNLASYCQKDQNAMFIIRLSQGLVHMGKGMLTLQPYYSDRFLLSKVGMAGIITVIHSCLDMKNIILEAHHYMLFFLSLSIYPRMLFTLTDDLENSQINVRVGQAVDVVGQAGKPKKITGFQTHTSPVLISYGERAELASEEYIPVQDTVLENFVIVKKNPDYVPEEVIPDIKKKK